MELRRDGASRRHAPAAPLRTVIHTPRRRRPLLALGAAKAEMLMGHWGRAEELYRQAVQLDPTVQQELLTCQIGELV